MRKLTPLLICLCLLISATTTMAGLKGDSLAFQGRLTDASDNPVPDGPRDLTLSLWTDPVGGTMLHSEVVVVTVSKGLYTTCIGCTSSSFFDIFTDQSVYLQVQLAGSPPMTPRTTLRSVPFSVSSSGVHGEATNGAAKAKGIISVKSASGSGSMTNGKFLLDADVDGDGVAEASDSSGVSEGAAGRRLQVHNLGSSGEDGVEITPISAGRRLAVHNLGSSGEDGVEISSAVTPSSASQIAGITAGGVAGRAKHAAVLLSSGDVNVFSSNDIDGDGAPDNEISQSLTPTTSGVAIKTKGTGADANRTVIITGLTALGTSKLSCAIDEDGDSVPESEISNIVTPTTSGVAINTKGTGAEKGRVLIQSTAPSPGLTTGSSVVRLDNDSDGDGVPESEISQLVTPTTSSVAINTKGTGADRNRTAGSACDDSLAIDYLDIDDDGDGISEAHAVSSVSSLGGGGGGGAAAASYAATGRWYTDSDDDGLPEGDIEAKVTPTVSSVAIKTKGTGADKDRVISSTTDTSKAVTVHSADIDGDGVEDAVVTTSSGVAEVGGIPGGVVAARVAIKTKGTGADPNRSSVSCSSSPSKSSVVCDQDSDGDGLADRSVTMDCDDTDGGITVEGAASKVKIRHKGWDGLIYGRMAIETGGAIEVDFGGNGVGFVSQRFGVGVLSPTHPIEHSSGAHLTAGGVWTNASDENLKENFQAVDGADLLEKIEQLPITEWNYKNESEDTKHIGPTAQDFQRVFGVGENDKTISTIDPSGIALAAIKELNSKLNTQNQTLSQENKQLRKELDELKKMVLELAKTK